MFTGGLSALDGVSLFSYFPLFFHISFFAERPCANAQLDPKPRNPKPKVHYSRREAGRDPKRAIFF